MTPKTPEVSENTHKSIEETLNKYDKLVLKLMGESAFSAYIRSFHHAKIKDFIKTSLQSYAQQQVQEKVEEIEGMVEELADIEHERWSRWQSYLHSKCVEHENGKGEWVCFPAELFRRWERQINTPYADLSEQEKESDREQVRPYLSRILSTLQSKGLEDKKESV